MISLNIKTNRGLTEEAFANVDDGKFFLADQALELGLIDMVGGAKEIKEYLAQEGEYQTDELLLCEPEFFIRN